MVRLIVDDAGKRRAFNVGEGRLSVGSGQEAKLRLESAGIASVHVEVEIHGGKATLHPKPGVTPPQVLGRAASGAVVLQHGVPVKIGSATLTVEYENQPASAQAAAPAAVRPRATASAGARSATRSRDADADEERPGRRGRPQGTPTWVWVAVGLPVVALVGYFVVGGMLGRDSGRVAEASAPAYYNNALERLKNSQLEQALAQLDRIPADAQIEPALKQNIAELRAKIEARIAETAEHAHNATAGKNYFDTQLKGFVESYMSGQITSPEARVFLKRARYFRENWPTHPDLEWVTRQEARFKGAIDLSKPPTFADVQFEVESLTWSFPRKYDEAFAVAQAFQASAQGDDVAKAAAFLAELDGKRKAWFDDRLQQAKFHYERKEIGKSVGVLLSIIRYAGDTAMEDDGATRLLQYGDAEEIATFLRGYRTNDPNGFEEVSKNRVIAGFLRDHPL